MNRFGSFQLLSAPHHLFSFWTDLKKSEKSPEAPTWRWGECIWLIGPSGLYRNSRLGLEYHVVRRSPHTAGVPSSRLCHLITSCGIYSGLIRIEASYSHWKKGRFQTIYTVSEKLIDFTSVAMHGETVRASWTFSHKKTKVKGIPIIGHEGPREMWMQGCTYLCIHSHGTRKR